MNDSNPFNDAILEARAYFQQATGGDEDRVEDLANLVAAEDGCRRCGERNADCLIWQADDESVRCTSCGASYDPKA